MDDPGWGAAFPYMLKALFARRRLLELRPAITAARAAALAVILTAIVLGVALTVFGAPSETDYPLTGAIVGFTVLAAAGMILRIRYGSLAAPEMDVDPVRHFLQYASLLTSLATVPTLSAFVCFFLGGGYLMYAIGAAATVILILGPARPGKSMAASLAAKITPPIPPETLWTSLLK